MVPNIHIIRTADGADFPLPSYTSKHHVGLNLMAAISAPVKIGPKERAHIPVGFAIAIPDGLCGQIVSNREMSTENGIIVADAPSILHPADRQPIFVLLKNETDQPFVLQRGMMIAQLLLTPVTQNTWTEVQSDDFQSTITEKIQIDTSNEEHIGAIKSSDKRPKVSIRERSSK